MVRSIDQLSVTSVLTRRYAPNVSPVLVPHLLHDHISDAERALIDASGLDRGAHDLRVLVDRIALGVRSANEAFACQVSVGSRHIRGTCPRVR